jgi:hypothetical protein
MAGYNGSATIVSRWGEIEVTVDLRSAAEPGGMRTWSGHVDSGDRDELRWAMDGMSIHGLTIRFPNGDEGNLMPSPETTWSLCSISVRGFMRNEGSWRRSAPADMAAKHYSTNPRQAAVDQYRYPPEDLPRRAG